MPPRRNARSNLDEGSTGARNNEGGDNNQGGNREGNPQNARIEEMYEFYRQNANRDQNMPPPNQAKQTAAAFKAFKSLNPPEFKGTTDPVEARAWIKEMEKSFEIVDVEDGKKTIFAGYLLKGEANYWWESKRDFEGAGIVTWERFKELFLEKYFPDYMQGQMEIKFLELKQGNMTVAEYEARFSELSRFVPHFVDTELKRARRFQYGLKPWLQKKVKPFELTEYSKVVQKATIIEEDDDFNLRDKNLKKRKAESWGGGNSAGGTFQNQVYKRPGSQQGFNSTVSGNNGPSGRQGSVTQSSPLPDCETCGKKHAGICLKGGGKCYNCGQEGHQQMNCPRKVIICYKCGKEGHIARDCKALGSGPAASRQRGGANNNQSTARIFNMTLADGMKEMDEMAGTPFLKFCKCID